MPSNRSEGTNQSRQAIIGVALAFCIIGAWAVTHAVGMFYYEWGAHSLVTAPLLIAFSCWLYVGLFIVAHDCMHGSLVPFKLTWNRAVGQLCLALYAGFEFDRLKRKHHLHHSHAGTVSDPDFDPRPPHGFLRWYLNFFTTYFGWKQLAFLSAVSAVYVLGLGVPYSNLVAFWAIPAVLSSLQLFYFGTYLPHRPNATAFVDLHRARSNEWSWLVSLLTCFHFGYHHEHHLRPGVPWWKLPNIRTQRSRAAVDPA